MEPYRPYKNYLPGKTIRITILVVVVGLVAYIAIPRIITFFKNRNAAPSPEQNNLVVAPSGDPTTRDTDRDGVSDWQEIAVGLDPHNPETVPGTLDSQKFETFKAAIGYDLFAEAEAEATDTDKISLALSHDITQSTQDGSADSASISNATAAEILNYIDAQKKQTVVYIAKDINVVESTFETNQAYALGIQAILKDDLVTKNFATDIKSYLDGGGSQQTITNNLSHMEKTLGALKSIPVPGSVSNLHLEILNGVQGVYQTVTTLITAPQDEFVRLSTLALLQDYAISLSTSAGKLSLYFSVALDKNGYIQ